MCKRYFGLGYSWINGSDAWLNDNTNIDIIRTFDLSFISSQQTDKTDNVYDLLFYDNLGIIQGKIFSFLN